MPGPQRPKGTQAWPEDGIFPAESVADNRQVGGPFGTTWDGEIRPAKRSSAKLIQLYENGFTGTFIDSDQRQQLYADQKKATGFGSFAEVAHTFGFASKFEYELTLPFIWEMVFWPGCLPGAAQERGDCVSHAASGAQRTTIAGDIACCMPDEQSKKLEGVPKIDPVGIKNGVTSSEYQYWFRGYDGDGWSCPTAAEVSLKRGCLLRNDYGTVDMRDYSGRLAGKYGRRSPPDEITALGSPHALHGVVEANSFEEIADACGSLRGINSCGGQGFSSTRDKYGYSPRRGGWSHGYKFSGTDGRKEIRAIFGEPLVLNNNNWGIWNSGPRDIYQSAALVPKIQALVNRVCGFSVDLVRCDIVNAQTGNLMIPPGCWWCKWSEVKNRDYSVYAGIKGWDRPLLRDTWKTGLG